MADINSCTFTGRLTRDAELKYTQGGMAVVRFSLAVDRRVKEGDAWKDIASFLDFAYLGKGAEAVNRYLTKGRSVAVNAECRQDSYDDRKTGEKRTRIEFVVNSLNLMGRDQTTQQEQSSADQRPKYDGKPAPVPEGFGPDDNIPF